MAALTKRQLHGRINEAAAQVAAMLLFYGNPQPHRSQRDLHYANDQMIKGLVYLADGLDDGFDPDHVCEGCGKPIRAGQAYAHSSEDSISFHAKCAGLDPKKCGRMETERHRRKAGRGYRERAKAYLKKRGLC